MVFWLLQNQLKADQFLVQYLLLSNDCILWFRRLTSMQLIMFLIKFYLKKPCTWWAEPSLLFWSVTAWCNDPQAVFSFWKRYKNCFQLLQVSEENKGTIFLIFTCTRSTTGSLPSSLTPSTWSTPRSSDSSFNSAILFSRAFTSYNSSFKAKPTNELLN